MQCHGHGGGTPSLNLFLIKVHFVGDFLLLFIPEIYYYFRLRFDFAVPWTRGRHPLPQFVSTKSSFCCVFFVTFYSGDILLFPTQILILQCRGHGGGTPSLRGVFCYFLFRRYTIIPEIYYYSGDILLFPTQILILSVFLNFNNYSIFNLEPRHFVSYLQLLMI